MVFIGGWRSGGPRRRYRRYGYPYGGGYGYGPRGGGGCLRNACLLESGCCLGEALAGNCLLSSVTVLPRFASAFVTGAGSGAVTRPSRARRQVDLRDRLVATIGVYQETISPHLAGTCRFTPSCSVYAAEALELHGAARGSWLTVRRLLRCRPGGPRGVDLVPGHVTERITRE